MLGFGFGHQGRKELGRMTGALSRAKKKEPAEL